MGIERTGMTPYLRRLPTLAAFTERDFTLMWGGLAVSNVGYWMQTFGMGWLVVQFASEEGVPERAALYLGVVNLARGVASVGFGLYGGVLADRVDRRRLLVAANLSGGAIAAVFAALTLAGAANVAWLIGFAVLSSVAQSLDGPARAAMVPRLVHPNDLMSALGLVQSAWHGSILVGPLLGGLLIVPFGAGGVFAARALSHIPVVLAVTAMRHRSSPSPVRHQGAVSAIGESTAFVRAEPVLSWSVVLLVGLAFFVRSHTQLLPVFVSDILHAGPQEFAWLLATSGAGTLTGALLLAPVGSVHRQGLLLLGTALLTGVLLATFASQRSFLPAALALALTGTATQVANGIATSFLQLRTPDALLGRVMALVNVSFGGLNPLGVMAIGTLATLTRIDLALEFAGVALAALSASAAIRATALRSVTDRPEDLPPPIAG